VDRRGTAGMKGSNHGNEQKGSEVTNVMSQACDIKSEWKAIHSYSLILGKACHRIPLPHKMQNKQPLDHLAEKRQNNKENGQTPAYCIYSKLKLRGWILAIYIIAYCNYLIEPFI